MTLPAWAQSSSGSVAGASSAAAAAPAPPMHMQHGMGAAGGVPGFSGGAAYGARPPPPAAAAPAAPTGRRFLDSSGAGLEAAGLPMPNLPAHVREGLIRSAVTIAGMSAPVVHGGMMSGPPGSRMDPRTRSGRRLYVGNLPPGATEPELVAFFSDLIAKTYKPDPGLVVSATCKGDRNFGFIEFDTMELATAAMGLDGVTFKGQAIKVQRPTDYDPSALPACGEPISLNLGALGIVSTQVPDGPNKIFVGGLAYQITEEQLKDLLQAYGPLRGLHLVKDPGATQSKGYAFCEYVDPAVTDRAVEGLNNLEVSEGRTLTVRRANPRGPPGPGAPPGGPPHGGHGAFMGGGFPGHGGPPPMHHGHAPPPGAPPAYGMAPQGPMPTTVLRVANMLSPAELANPAEVEEIRREAMGACGAHGQVQAAVIPTSGPAAGVVFVKFADVRAAQAAAQALGGKTFDGRMLQTSFAPEAQFAAGNFV